MWLAWCSACPRRSGYSARAECGHARTSARDKDESRAADERALAELDFAKRGPWGGWGFSFGMPGADARRVCAASGHRVTPGVDGFTCSGAPGRQPDPAVQVHVWLLQDRVAGAELVARPVADARVWAQAFRLYRQELVRVWGRPTSVDIDEPTACRRTTALIDCLRSGAAHATNTWRWPDGRHVVLEMSARAGEEPAIRVRYDAAVAAPDR